MYNKFDLVIFTIGLEGDCDLLRLQKYLADCGVASRRASEELIKSGRVAVNGEIVREMGVIVDETTDEIMFDGQVVTPVNKKIYVMPPDFDARKHLFKMYLEERPLNNIDYDILAGQTINYSCSDIEFICNEAARQTVSKDLSLKGKYQKFAHTGIIFFF